MDFRELRSLAIEGKLQGRDRVWRNENEDHQRADTVMGLIPPVKREAETPPPSDLSDEDPYAPPKARTIADGPPGGLYLPHLRRTSYPVFLAVLIISAVLLYGGWKVPNPDTKPILFSLGGFGLIFWFFLATVYLHRAWEMMRMFGAPLDGSKAVRFFFFPVFNALWSFVALFGWARLWNRSVKTHPGLAPASAVWQPFFFAFPVLFLVSQTLVIMHIFINEWPTDLQNQSHQISLTIWGLTLFVTLVCWFQLSQSINFLARKKS